MSAEYRSKVRSTVARLLPLLCAFGDSYCRAAAFGSASARVAAFGVCWLLIASPLLFTIGELVL